ncbi:hypothetical protein [Psychroflexus aurantiacus]|nr:hypothetical protein [Psychroflexus aurantiacus]
MPIEKETINQELHHTSKTFKEEYLHVLKEFSIEFDERYVFKSVL